jgi:hypothetical protein
MAWLLIAAAAVVILIVAALAIPVHLDVRAELTDRLRGRARLRWLFGLVDVPLGGGHARAQPPQAEGEVAVRDGGARPRTGKSSGRGRRFIAALRTSGVMERVILFVRGVFGQLHLRNFVMRARYGFEDPADTGQLCGSLAPLLVFASVKGVDVRCTPDFDGAAFEGTCSGTISMRPLSAVGVVVVFLCSPPVWRAARAWRRAS